MHKNFGNLRGIFVQIFLKKNLTKREICGIIGANHGSRPDGFRRRHKKNRRFRLLINYYCRRHSYTNNYLTYSNYRPIRNGFRKIIIVNWNKNKKPDNNFYNINFNFHHLRFPLSLQAILLQISLHPHQTSL